MSLYREVFKKCHTLLIVIHAESAEPVLSNARIAFGEGADGIFLINHNIIVPSLVLCYQVVREAYPDTWIGLNYLGCSSLKRFGTVPADANGIWADDARVSEHDPDPVKEARDFNEFRSSQNSGQIYFGGVAFKYVHPEISDVAKVAELAVPFVDVVTTSGMGTGSAPDVEKIQLMKAAIKDHPLAIASGITPENVEMYLPYADCFLVATGVSDSDTMLDRARVNKLVRAIEK